MTSSKKGVSAHQLHRTLGINRKSAWFMEHRIREAMAPDGKGGPIGGEGQGRRSKWGTQLMISVPYGTPSTWPLAYTRTQ